MMKFLLILPMLFMLGDTRANDSYNIENLLAFSKAYGYVKYFHPSHEANQIDWKKFAAYGVEKMSICKTKEERIKTLNELFKPLGPSIEFSSSRTTYDINKITPEDTHNYRPVFWQHYGVSTGHRPQNPLKSIRVNGYTSVDVSDKQGGFNNAVDITPYQGKEVKLTCWARVNSKTGSTGHLYMNVAITEEVYGFAKIMDEYIISSDWQQYEIVGNVDLLGSQLHFGSYLNGKGSLFVDDVSLSVKEDGEWKKIEVPHSDFEADWSSITSKKGGGWYKKGEGYQVNQSSIGSHSGKKCIEISYEGKESLFRNPPIFSASPNIGEVIIQEIEGGIYCAIPLALYGKKNETFPKSNKLDETLIEISKIDVSPNMLNVRLGNVINTYNVFKHFFPYFNDVAVNWDRELVKAFNRSYSDQSEKDHLITLQKFTATLRDGHIFILDNREEWFSPPITWEWIEEELVITEVLDMELDIQVGDIVSEVNGQSPSDYYKEICSRISAGTKGYLEYIANVSSLIGEKDTYLKVVINDKTLHLKRTRINDGAKGLEIQKHTYLALDDGIVYLNLSKVNKDTIDKIMPFLENARGIICDSRGYFDASILPHLLSERDTSSSWHSIAEIIYPDQENITGRTTYPWDLEPQMPYLGNKRIVFLTDGRAVSSSESSMSFVKHYHIGTIIGQPTAGANGVATTFSLLGNISVRWTSSKVVKHDGSTHFGIGILPDIYVDKTIEGIKKGKDEFILKAIEIINDEI